MVGGGEAGVAVGCCWCCRCRCRCGCGCGCGCCCCCCCCSVLRVVCCLVFVFLFCFLFLFLFFLLLFLLLLLLLWWKFQFEQVGDEPILQFLIDKQIFSTIDYGPNMWMTLYELREPSSCTKFQQVFCWTSKIDPIKTKPVDLFGRVSEDLGS